MIHRAESPNVPCVPDDMLLFVMWEDVAFRLCLGRLLIYLDPQKVTLPN